MRKRDSFREISKLREPGEPVAIKFDESLHPGLIKRLTLFGLSKDEIAALLGVSPSTMFRWISAYPDLEMLVSGGRALADAEVVASLYDQAVGSIDPDTGRRKGANFHAAAFWLKNRQGWSDKADPEREDEGRVTAEEVKGLTKDIIREAETKQAELLNSDGSTDALIDAHFSEFDE